MELIVINLKFKLSPPCRRRRECISSQPECMTLRTWRMTSMHAVNQVVAIAIVNLVALLLRQIFYIIGVLEGK